MSYLTLLLILHIGGAIIGFGPVFTFGVLGPLAGKLGGPQGLGILKAMVKIEKTFLFPFLVIQPTTGTLLIFKESLNQDFFSHTWLWVAILIFVAAVVISLTVQTPAVEHLVELAESGQAESEEFKATTKKTQTFGPILTLMLVAIILLMIWKPGA